MLDIKFIIANADNVRENCLRRKVDPNLVDQAIQWYIEKKKVSQERDDLVHRRKNIQNATKDRLAQMETVRDISIEIGRLTERVGTYEKEFHEVMQLIPNMTHPSVETKDAVVKTVGKERGFAFEPRTHLDLGETLDILDIKKAADISGSKFYYLKNDAVLLEQALIHHALMTIRKHGFSIFSTPDIARAKIIEEMGFAARGDSTQIYGIAGTEQCLVGTAEITLGALHREEVLSKLPIRYGGISHCFRKEAGTYGKEGKGLYRVHQFAKVEMFVFCAPEDSDKTLHELVAIQESIYDSLKLPYRVVNINSYDLGCPAYQKYDLEAWMPGINKWGEITSASNCTDYQSRRLMTRYLKGSDKEYAHTLNATAVAVPRTLIAIIENYQTRDGSVEVPEVLRPLVGKEIIK